MLSTSTTVVLITDIELKYTDVAVTRTLILPLLRTEAFSINCTDTTMMIKVYFTDLKLKYTDVIVTKSLVLPFFTEVLIALTLYTSLSLTELKYTDVIVTKTSTLSLFTEVLITRRRTSILSFYFWDFCSFFWFVRL